MPYARRDMPPTSTTASRLVSILAVASLAGGCAAAIAVLHHAGGGPAGAIDWLRLWAWLEGSSAEQVLLGLGRLAALGLLYWIAGSMVLYTAACATGLPRLIRSVEWMVLPPLRRIAERAAALTLAVATLSPGATAMAAPRHEAEPPAVAASEQPGAPAVPIPAADAPVVIPVPTAPDAAEPEPRAVPPPPFAPRPAAVPAHPPRFLDPAKAEAEAARVRPAREAVPVAIVAGDNLWTVAEHHLEAALGRAPTDAETAAYWVEVIAANRTTLRSGDPDLIYPGEVIVCPAIAPGRFSG